MRRPLLAILLPGIALLLRLIGRERNGRGERAEIGSKRIAAKYDPLTEALPEIT